MSSIRVLKLSTNDCKLLITNDSTDILTATIDLNGDNESSDVIEFISGAATVGLSDSEIETLEATQEVQLLEVVSSIKADSLLSITRNNTTVLSTSGYGKFRGFDKNSLSSDIVVTLNGEGSVQLWLSKLKGYIGIFDPQGYTVTHVLK